MVEIPAVADDEIAKHSDDKVAKHSVVEVPAVAVAMVELENLHLVAPQEEVLKQVQTALCVVTQPAVVVVITKDLMMMNATGPAAIQVADQLMAYLLSS